MSFIGQSVSAIYHELVNIPRLNTASAYTAKQTLTPVVLTDGATIAWNWNSSQSATVSIAGSRTLSNPTNATTGQYAALYVTRTGSFSLSFDTLFKGITSISQSTTPGLVDHFVFRYNGTNYELVSFRANVGA